MKKLLFIIFTALIVGCSVPAEDIEKDKTFLKSKGLRYEHVLLNWNEPVQIKYLSTDKYIAVWEKNYGFGSGYYVRILFDRKKVMGWKIEEMDADKILSKELSMSK